jgi:putative transposase
VLRGGIAWRLLPHDVPKGKTVYDYCWKWRRAGPWEEINGRLRQRVRTAAGGQAQPTAAILDSQTGKTTHSGGPRGDDGGQKGKGRKRHLLVDTLGLVLKAFVQEADGREPDAAPALVAGARLPWPTGRPLWVDRISRGWFVEWVQDQRQRTVEVVKRPSRWRWYPPGVEPVARPAFTVLARRWVVEISQAECPYSVCHRSSYHWQRRFATTVEPSTAFAADRRTFTSGRCVMPDPSRLCGPPRLPFPPRCG